MRRVFAYKKRAIVDRIALKIRGFTKKIIIDTDIGADSDDAIALSLLLKAERESLCKILEVTVCTARDGAAETARTFSEFYNKRKIPVGKMNGALKCDEVDYYAKTIKDRYKAEVECVDATKLLRRTLAQSAEKVTFVGIGPFSTPRQPIRRTRSFSAYATI